MSHTNSITFKNWPPPPSNCYLICRIFNKQRLGAMKARNDITQCDESQKQLTKITGHIIKYTVAIARPVCHNDHHRSSSLRHHKTNERLLRL